MPAIDRFAQNVRIRRPRLTRFAQNGTHSSTGKTRFHRGS
jgi:hypothetical protein